ncbi:hypothetical protein NB640_09135 [Oxalobacter vibrioformis]|uniref:Uncharacterized protein n=1 Tax=Oxalobacter vibrioformis TaxID=933080 RepID=A0A9E9LV35_9BURK|nr:hypothetical protein [Oxalobacter vibrioformis]NLC23102.1 hypothetical protein [Oxalobacter sp.]WAW09409.1 hypothetical protein NB640_09135 [Oxalobacter vibrioformis]
MSEKEKADDTLMPVWASMLSASLKQTLILSYLNKKFPGAIQAMLQEFDTLSDMLDIQPEVKEDITKTLDGLPKMSEENNPFRIISNEIMADTVIQTLILRYFMKSNPDMARAMLEDFQLILAELNLNDPVKERVTTSLSEFLPE